MIDYSNVNYIDLIILFVLLATSVIGLYNGFVKEFFNLCSWTLSLLFPFLIINKLLVSNLIDLNIIYLIILFFLLFLFSFIILKALINYFVGDLNSFINYNYLNNIFGLIFGLAKGLFLIAFVISGIMYLFYTTKDFPPTLSNSLFFELIKSYSIKIIEKIVNFI